MRSIEGRAPRSLLLSTSSPRHGEVVQRKEGRSHAADGGAGSTQVSALPPKADILGGGSDVR